MLTVTDSLEDTAPDRSGPARSGVTGLEVVARLGCLGHPQAVEGEQRVQGVLGRGAEPGGDEEECADFVAVQAGGVGFVVEPGPSDVHGRCTARITSGAARTRPAAAIR